VIRRVLVVALAACLAAGVAACGDDDGAQGEPVGSTIDPDSTSTALDGELPPPQALDLEPLYGEALAAIGMQLTDRGGTIDRSGGGYVASPDGTHLALYVEPIGDRTTEQYIDGILDVALVFSDIYDRWPGLESYDVCQEPLDPDGTQGPEPLPVTQIELTRAQSDAIDWESVTVDDLVRGSLADPPELALRVSAELAADPAYRAIVGDDTSSSVDDDY
jgi:hypothetical protein